VSAIPPRCNKYDVVVLLNIADSPSLRSLDPGYLCRELRLANEANATLRARLQQQEAALKVAEEALGRAAHDLRWGGHVLSANAALAALATIRQAQEGS
jgi:hypothetical protein